MGQTSLTSINLIVESIELKKTELINMLEELKNDLSFNQFSINLISSSMLRIYKMKDREVSLVFSYIKNAQALKKISDLCDKILRSLKKIIIVCEELPEINSLLLLCRIMKNIVTQVVIVISENNIELAKEIYNQEDDYNVHIEDIKRSSIDFIKKESGYTPAYIEIISITKNLYSMSILTKDILKNIIDLEKYN
jgi:phosphate uptake regulator